jgi:hypothetical protein
MPECPQLSKRVGAIDIGVTATQLQAFAKQVDAQIEGVAIDVARTAADPHVQWDLKVGTAWLSFYRAWKDEYAAAQDASWYTFGMGSAYERIRDWQLQAKDWQARVAKISGRPSSIPEIHDTTTAGDIESGLMWAGAGAAGALLLLLLLKR